MDYLLRDSYYTGVAYGVIDVERLIYNMTLENNLMLKRKGVQAAESMLLARYFMYPSVYQHHTTRIINSMFRRCLNKLFQLQLVDPEKIYLYDDLDFLLAMAGLPAEGARFARPDYGGFPTGEYLSPGPILPYSASSGCHWRRCTFCPERAEGHIFRPVPEEQVLSDLGALVADVRPALIHFLDSTMSPRLLDLLSRRPPGAPWYGFTRVSPRLGDGDFCRALRASGCVMLKLGLESGDQGVLDALEKGIRVDEASRALRSLKEAGIGTYVYLLFGTPAEDADSAERTLAFTARHAGLIDYLNLAVFNLPAASEEAGRLTIRPFYEGDLSLYADFEHPSGWGRREVRDFLDRRFRRHPSIAPIVRRQPPLFTSNHAPFFLNFC